MLEIIYALRYHFTIAKVGIIFLKIIFYHHNTFIKRYAGIGHSSVARAFCDKRRLPL